MQKINGRVVYKLSDDINTDKILAGRYLILTGDEELAAHCFEGHIADWNCLLYTSPSPRDRQKSRMPSSA